MDIHVIGVATRFYSPLLLNGYRLGPDRREGLGQQRLKECVYCVL